MKSLAATSTWLSAEENTSVSIIAVVISQVIKVHLNIKDTDVPGIKQFKKSVASGLTRRFQLDSSVFPLSVPLVDACLDYRWKSLR